MAALFFITVLSSVSGALAAPAPAVTPECRAFGKDLQNGGTYFQNASSMDQFTFVEYFEGCQQDSSSNILVDPAANEYFCTGTPLTPDDADFTSTCPITKNQLYSGDWSIIVSSNNGNATPIAYERDFKLVVGIPSTYTYYPTVTVTSIKTPGSTKTITTTTNASTTTTATITLPLVTLKPTTTVIPRSVTSTSYSITSTITKLAFTAEPLITTSYSTKTCSVPPKQTTPDTTAQYSPTLLSATANQKRAAPTAGVILVVRDESVVALSSVRKSKEQFIEERRKRLHGTAGIDRRGLDQSTTTVTATDPSQFITATSVSTANVTTTVTTTIEATSYSTITTTSTYLSGTTTGMQSTITASTPTVTKTSKINTTITSTITQKPLITIVIPTALPGTSASCKSAGGKLV